MSNGTKATSKARSRILIVDDHPVTRYGVAQLIQHEHDLGVCNEAGNAQQALTLLNPLPDLILTDLTLPGKSGLEFIRDVCTHHPTVPILVLSMHDETVFAERALRAGARGYIMKCEGGKKLLEAIRRVLRGDYYFSDRVSANIMGSFTKTRQGSDLSQLSALTDREFEVFSLISQALSTSEIGERLHISGKTVETHRLKIKEKLKLKSSGEVRRFALRWGATQNMI